MEPNACVRLRNNYNQGRVYQTGTTMIQVIAATFADGVFKPDQQPALSESTRVRLVVEPMSEDADEPRRRQA